MNPEAEIITLIKQILQLEDEAAVVRLREAVRNTVRLAGTSWMRKVAANYARPASRLIVARCLA